MKNMGSSLAWVMRCIDMGRDRVFARFLAPLTTAIAVSTWIKVNYPSIEITTSLFIIFLLALAILIFWCVAGALWQNKMLHHENDFDMMRNPMFMEVYNTLSEIKHRMEMEQG